MKESFGLFRGLVIAFTIVFFAGLYGCGSDDKADGKLSAADYGVPAGIDLSAPCPGNGTWIMKQTKSSTPSTWGAKIVIKDWLVEIYETWDWYNTGVCTTINYGGSWTYCDYKPRDNGTLVRGYINPNQGSTDSDGHTYYAGKTVRGDDIIYYDFAAPDKLYFNFKRAEETGETWYKRTLY